MKSLSYAMVTPSYWKDVERCRFLVETARSWVAPGVRHYLVIAHRDVPLFKSMLHSGVDMIVVEDIIPRWLFRVPGLRHFWLSLRTRPVKNWILQQIVKLSVPGAVSEDVLLYADSDMFFIDHFDPRSFERDGKVPLLFETGQRGLIPANDMWQITAATLLGIPPEEDFDVNYIGQLVWWRRENALGALRRVAETTGRDWQQAIAPLSGFAEYILYGIYSHRVLGPASGHWYDDTHRTLNYWGTTPLDLKALEAMRSSRTSQCHSAMVSAKSGTAVEDIRKVFALPPA
jgi:hypothetical protein